MRARQRLDQKRKGALQGAPAARVLDVGPATGPCAKKDALRPGGGGSAGQSAHHTGEGRPHKGRLSTLTPHRTHLLGRSCPELREPRQPPESSLGNSCHSWELPWLGVAPSPGSLGQGCAWLFFFLKGLRGLGGGLEIFVPIKSRTLIVVASLPASVHVFGLVKSLRKSFLVLAHNPFSVSRSSAS